MKHEYTRGERIIILLVVLLMLVEVFPLMGVVFDAVVSAWRAM